VIPLLAATVLVVIVVSVLGWWHPVMKADLAVPRWMLIVPSLLILISLAGTDWSRLSDMGAGYVAALAGAVLLVGFNEEIMDRHQTVLPPIWTPIGDSIWAATSLAVFNRLEP
jgi:hypothetical protein